MFVLVPGWAGVERGSQRSLGTRPGRGSVASPQATVTSAILGLGPDHRCRRRLRPVPRGPLGGEGTPHHPSLVWAVPVVRASISRQAGVFIGLVTIAPLATFVGWLRDRSFVGARRHDPVHRRADGDVAHRSWFLPRRLRMVDLAWAVVFGVGVEALHVFTVYWIARGRRSPTRTARWHLAQGALGLPPRSAHRRGREPQRTGTSCELAAAAAPEPPRNRAQTTGKPRVRRLLAGAPDDRGRYREGRGRRNAPARA